MDDRPATRILLTPQGTPLTQPIVEELAQQPRLLMIAGHYEGIDERVIQKLAPIQEISIGDYVLSGGELPAMVLIDAIVRLIPGALGHQDSAHHDSFSPGSHRLLDHPHYTRPRTWQDMEAPEILLSGDHAKIEAWRKQQALERTRERRPDLLK
jgi:tRNA (guanine37-N1)-methyltransferase